MQREKIFLVMVFFTLLFCVSQCRADICHCSSCEECQSKLNEPNCSHVDLSQSIDCYSLKVYNKTFDCQGFTVKSNKEYKNCYWDCDLNSYIAIYAENSTIENCVITSQYIGIASSSNNLIFNNTLNKNENGINSGGSNNTIENNKLYKNGIFLNGQNNKVLNNDLKYGAITLHFSDNNYVFGNNLSKIGIELRASSNNTIENNIANSGIHLGQSANNKVFNNTFCGSGAYDIMDQNNGSDGDGNTCNRVRNWKDLSAESGCSKTCTTNFFCRKFKIFCPAIVSDEGNPNEGTTITVSPSYYSNGSPAYP